jgi:predicted Zn-dependent protease
VIRMRLQQFAQAAELLDAAASVDPRFPGVQYALGVSRFNAGEIAKAAAPLAQAVAQDPGNPAARRLLAMVSINGEMYEEAIDLLQNDPDLKTDPAISMALGIALTHGNRSTEAEAIFVRLLREHGPSASLFVGLGRALAYQGRFEPATAAASKALALDARVPEGRSVLGFIQLQTGRLAEAEESLRAELVAHPDQVESQRLLAAVLQAQGRNDEAIPLLRAIVDAWPDAPDARLRLSEAYTKAGKTELAKEQMETYRRLAKKQSGENRRLDWD